MKNYTQDNFRHLVRIYSTDIAGELKIRIALTYIKGVSHRFSGAILRTVGVDESLRAGFLSDKMIEKIEEALADPINVGIPEWMLNRQKDPETGENVQLLESNLLLQQRTDIDRMIRKRAWRGIRHSRKLKVRGQRTRSTGRGATALGVSKRKER